MVKPIREMKLDIMMNLTALLGVILSLDTRRPLTTGPNAHETIPMQPKISFDIHLIDR
jgi:hypothetical protein